MARPANPSAAGMLNLNPEVEAQIDWIMPMSMDVQGEAAGTNFGEFGKTQANILVRSEIRLFRPPHPEDSDKIICSLSCFNSAPHKNTEDLSVPGSLCCGKPLARRNSLSRLKRSKMLRKTASVAQKSLRQKQSAPKSCFNSAIRFSISAR